MISELGLQLQPELEQMHKKKCQSWGKQLEEREIPREADPKANKHDCYQDAWLLKQC